MAQYIYYLQPTTTDNYLKGRVVVDVVQDTTENTSTISYTIYFRIEDTTAGAGLAAALGSDSACHLKNVDSGSVKTHPISTTAKAIKYTWTPIVSRSFGAIQHDAYGRAPKMELKLNLSLTPYGQTFTIANNTFSLSIPNITRAAYINSAPNFNDEGNPTINYYNPYGSSVSSLQACISITGAKDDVPYRDIPKTGSVYTFQLTTAERTTLINSVVNGSTVPVRFYIKTILNGAALYSYVTRTFSLTDFEPYLDPVVIDMNDAAFALTNDRNTFIQGFSQAACQFNAIAKKGAAILNYKVVNGSQTAERTTGLAAIDKVESADFIFTVTDSRGNSASKTVTVNLIEYFKPTCSQEASIVLSDETLATVKLVVSGEWSSRHFGDVHNTLRVEYRYKMGSSGTYSAWSGTDYITDNNEYKVTFTIEDLDYTKTYTFQSRAVDLLDSAETAEYQVKLIPVFDWSEEDFNFNVPVHFAQGYTVGDGDTTGDYIIERGTEAMGTNGTWYWSKWASGRADCYGLRNYGNMAVSTSWGGLYRSESFSQALPSGLFSGVPAVININLQNGSYGGWIARHEATAPSEDETGGFIVVRPASATISQAYIGFNIIGRWK